MLFPMLKLAVPARGVPGTQAARSVWSTEMPIWGLECKGGSLGWKEVTPCLWEKVAPLSGAVDQLVDLGVSSLDRSPHPRLGTRSRAREAQGLGTGSRAQAGGSWRSRKMGAGSASAGVPLQEPGSLTSAAPMPTFWARNPHGWSHSVENLAMVLRVGGACRPGLDVYGIGWVLGVLTAGALGTLGCWEPRRV